MISGLRLRFATGRGTLLGMKPRRCLPGTGSVGLLRNTLACPSVSDFLYLRWIGQHGTFKNHTDERIDRSHELGTWWEEIKKTLDQVEGVYGFFNNDYAGFAPGTANRFKEAIGLPVEPLRQPEQRTLF